MNRAELLRYERGLTVKDVAEQTNLSRPTITSIEKGLAKPGPATAKRLAEFYEVSVAELLGVDLKDAA